MGPSKSTVSSESEPEFLTAKKYARNNLSNLSDQGVYLSDQAVFSFSKGKIPFQPESSVIMDTRDFPLHLLI